MSVDKVSPIPPSPVDPLGAKSGDARPAFSPTNVATEATRAFTSLAAAAPNSAALSSSKTLLPSYYNMPSSVLAAMSLQSEGEEVGRLVAGGGDALASIAYESTRTPRAKQVETIAARLPQEAIARSALAALEQNAMAQDKPVLRALRSMIIAEPSALPSQNAPDAQFGLQTSFVANDKFGNPMILDLYLARTGRNSWEAAVYNREDASLNGGFPYSAPPLLVDRLMADPATEQILASVAGQILFSKQNNASSMSPALFALAGVIILASIIWSFLVASDGHAFVAVAIAAAGVYGATLAARSKWLF
jgi:hypothetical protein